MTRPEHSTLLPRPLAQIAQIYASEEKSAHYHWRFGILVTLTLGLVLTVAELAHRRPDGIVAAFGVWFVALAVPPRTVSARLLFLGRRLVLLVATTGLGALLARLPTGPTRTAWACLIIVALALSIPVPGFTITPLITFIMGMDGASGLGPSEQIGAFACGGALAVIVLLLPAAASPVAAEFTGLGIQHPWRRLRQHLITRSPELRYAGQAAALIVALHLLTELVHWPHAGWLLVGVLTTLRPSWAATRARTVKRSIGMIAGAALSAALLLLTAGEYWLAMLAVAGCGGLARPLRQYNYGYWPILGTPVLLLLINQQEQLTLFDTLLRLLNNLAGASITLVAVCLLWPHPNQRPFGGRRHPAAPGPT